MAARVTDTDVQGVVVTSLTTTPFITAAHALVDAQLLTSGLSEDVLTSIELFAAASFVARADPRVTLKAMDDMRVQYEGGAVWEQLWAIALSLDTTGHLVMTGKRAATFEVF
jgi:hypothetical protein